MRQSQSRAARPACLRPLLCACLPAPPSPPPPPLFPCSCPPSLLHRQWCVPAAAAQRGAVCAGPCPAHQGHTGTLPQPRATTVVPGGCVLGPWVCASNWVIRRCPARFACVGGWVAVGGGWVGRQVWLWCAFCLLSNTVVHLQLLHLVYAHHHLLCMCCSLLLLLRMLPLPCSG